MKTCECGVFFLKRFLASRFTTLILPRGYPACPVQTVHVQRFCLYAHICACPDKAAQMYFGSMNYAFVQPDLSLPCA